MESHDALRAAIATRLGCDAGDVTLFFKGRVALYAILKAAGIGRGDEVIVPAFTCVAAVNPLLYLGCKPVYVDIDPRTYTLNTDLLASLITSATRAILAQNTFGLSCDLDAVRHVARKHDILVIEDCAQGFGGSYRGQPAGMLGTAAFFSTQWNKPFSTGLGGIAVSHEPRIAAALRQIERDCVEPSATERLMLRALLALRTRIMTSGTYWGALKLYRWLSFHNLILGSSQGGEIAGTEPPRAFAKRMATLQAGRGVKELAHFDAVLTHRQKTAERYDEILGTLGVGVPFRPQYAVHTFLRYPLLVTDRRAWFESAQRDRVEFGDWFVSPLHPVTEGFEKWLYAWGQNPVAEEISQHIVNLPTHPGIDERSIEHTESFLNRNRKQIVGSFSDLATRSRP